MDLRSLQTFGSRFPERINQIIFVRLPQLGVRAVKPDSGQRQSGFLLAEGDHVASENSVSNESSQKLSTLEPWQNVAPLPYWQALA